MLLIRVGGRERIWNVHTKEIGGASFYQDSRLFEKACNEADILQEAKEKGTEAEDLYRRKGVAPGSIERFRKRLPYTVLKLCRPQIIKVKEDADQKARQEIRAQYGLSEEEFGYMTDGKAAEIVEVYRKTASSEAQSQISALRKAHQGTNRLLRNARRYVKLFG